MKSQILVAASRFHALAATASRNGGMWISAAGGSANVIAGVIAAEIGASFDEAHRALDLTADDADEWYRSLAAAQPWPSCHLPEFPRWTVETVARAACRAVIRLV